MNTPPLVCPADASTINIRKEYGVLPRARGNQSTKKKRPKYVNLVAAFDIETTCLSEIEQAVMYVWQFQLGERCTVMGRTWDEFDSFLRQLTSCLKDDETLAIWIHNLSYEFVFLSGLYDFKTDNVFCLDSRKVARASLPDLHVEFRCSYIHSNMSLAQYASKMKADHAKLSGIEFDYSKRRFPWTPLTDREMEYCQNDVVCLVEAVTNEMAIDGDNLNTIPMTSTGYVRRDAKAAMRAISRYYVKDQLPDLETMYMLREAFRGGNTHANRYMADLTLENVKSADRSSSYPDVLCNCKFPVSPFYRSGPCTIDEAIHLIRRRGKAMLLRCRLSGVRLTRLGWPCPYLPIDKCRGVLNPVLDNGRILQADYLETTLTDIDLEIVLSEYSFDDLQIIDSAYARYGTLPQPFISLNLEYYGLKTELKGVPDQEVYYTKAKTNLTLCMA